MSESVTRERLGKEAITWLMPAARQGVARAQADLAGIFLEGKLAPQDLIEAYKWGALATKAPTHTVERTAGEAARDAAVLKMSVHQIAEAERRLTAFKPQTPAQAERSGAGEADQIELKGIIGPPSRRLALIHNAIFAKGETAEIKLGQRTIVIHCLEINDDSVVVMIDGNAERHELRIGILTELGPGS